MIMERSNNDNHKAGKQGDTRKEKVGNKQVTTTASNTTSTKTDKAKTHYHTPHAF